MPVLPLLTVAMCARHRLLKAIVHVRGHHAVPVHPAVLVLKIVATPLRVAMVTLRAVPAHPVVVVASVTVTSLSPKIPTHHVAPPSSVTAPEQGLAARDLVAATILQTVQVRRVALDSVTVRDHPVAPVLQAVPAHPAVVVRRSPVAAVHAGDNVPEV
jgi:hypothetical protein